VGIALAGVALVAAAAVALWPRSAPQPVIGAIDSTTGADTSTPDTGRPDSAPRQSTGTSQPVAAARPDDRRVPSVPDETSRTRPAGSGVTIDSVALLRTIFNPDQPEADSARRVIALAEGLLRGARGDSARIETWYVLAEAKLFLGEDDAACAALREARGISERTGFLARSINLLHSRHC
jgi:hypothetical protein